MHFIIVKNTVILLREKEEKVRKQIIGDKILIKFLEKNK